VKPFKIVHYKMSEKERGSHKAILEDAEIAEISLLLISPLRPLRLNLCALCVKPFKIVHYKMSEKERVSHKAI
jgi:hypothetical protein